MTNSDINISLDDALALFPAALARKVEYFVGLLRKADRIALSYDPTEGYYLAFSGGKDSQALYHVSKLAGVKFKAHMNLTSVDPPEVIRFVRSTYPDVHMIPPKDSIYNIAVRKKGILPSIHARWCCAEFKERAGAGKVTLIGIRHEESVRRAKRNEVEIDNRKYGGTLEGLDEYRKEKLAKESGRKANKAGEVNITNATGERTLGCISGKESLLISPIIHWTERDVWAFLNAIGATHCSLYDEGWHRIGCINCPMGGAKQHAIENARYPHVKRNWIKAIMAIRRVGQNDTGRSARGVHKYNAGLWAGNIEGISPDDEMGIAEAIYDWWLSGKSYKQWYAERYQQLHIDFDNKHED